jgi:PAS domain S-box-containing protein
MMDSFDHGSVSPATPRGGQGRGGPDEAARIGAEIVRAEGGTDPFAASVRATRMPMIITDPRQPDNPVVFANNAFCRLTGYSRDEILGRNCRFLQGPQTDPATVQRIRAAISGGQPLEIDIRNHRKDGEPFWNRLLMAPVRDETGAIAYYFASQVDVTLERERLAGLEHRNAALVAELADRLRSQEESEARLRFATRAGRLGIWELDLVTGVLTASAICRQNFGRDADVPLGVHDLAGAVHPDDLDRVTAVYQEAIANGSDFAVQYGVNRPDGSVGWVDLRAQVVRGADGAPQRMAGTSLDITDRHAAEARLALSEAHLRLATEAAEVGTWDLDMSSQVLTWSDRTRAMFGFPPDAVCTMADFYAALHPDDFAATYAAFAAAVNPAIRAPYDVEYRTVGRYDGVVRWVAAKGRGLFDDGTCTRAMGTAINITRRKLAQARQSVLLTLTERLRTMTDPRSITQEALDVLGRHLGAARVGYGQVQEDGAHIVLDTGYADGLPPLAGRFRLDDFGPGNIERQRSGKVLVLHDAAADPGQVGVDWKGVGVGAVVSVPLVRNGRLRASLFVNQAGAREWLPEDVGLIEDVAALIWDAVERARAEEALRDLNATLEARVEERTAELRQAEEALRQAQKMEAVGQLTGGIAHDFNNLLTGIVGSLELLQRRVAEGRVADLQRYATMAVTSANRAAALTQRLLAFARRQPLDPKPVEVNRLVASMEDLLRRTLGPQVALEMVTAGGLWPALCDPNQLESAILNLAINARDAMRGGGPGGNGFGLGGPAAGADVSGETYARPGGGSRNSGVVGAEGGRLTIETANVELDEAYCRAQGGEVSPGQYVAVSVTDTGTGMPQEVIDRVFEPFFTTKPLGQGTGLGLSMLYGFIKQSNGHVRIYSEVGQGTTFHVYLPRSGAEAAGVSADGAFAAENERGSAGERVLVVEDEPSVRMLITETLHELGYVALEAVDGPSGLKIVQSGVPVDLMITDVGLPGLNGRQVADAARALRPDLKVLFITGFAGNAAIGHGMLEPGMQILTKPFSMDALAAKLRSMAE